MIVTFETPEEKQARMLREYDALNEFYVTVRDLCNTGPDIIGASTPLSRVVAKITLWRTKARACDVAEGEQR